jgi:small-conductance mechanosensitive channel
MKRTLLFSLLFCASTAASRGAPSGTAPAEPAPATIVSTAAVTLGGKPVLLVRERLLSLTAEERAERVSARVARLAKDPLADPQKLEVSDGELSSDIVSGDMVIMSVTDKDARTAGLPRHELAIQNARLITEALLAYKKDYNLKSLLLGALLALLSTALFVAALKLLASAYSSSLPRVDAWARANIKSIKLQQLELVNAGRITGIIRLLLQSARILATLLLIYFYIPILFSFFPWTSGLSPILFGYILHPLASLIKSFLSYIPDLIFVAVTVAVVHYLLRLLSLVTEELRNGHITLNGFYPDWARPTFQIARFITWAFTLVIIFPYLPGSDSPAFKGVSVFLGVLFSLGSSSAIANAVAGIMLTYMRPFKTGDRVKIGETTGDVMEKTLLVTRVKTIKNVSVTMPNALVLASHMINYSSRAENEGIILNTCVTLGYDAPWPRVHELLIAAAADTANIMKDPAPFVLQTALNDYNVSYELNAYTDEPTAMAATYSSMHANIQDKFNAAGIEIMSPAFTGIRDANAPATPAAAAEKPRGFKVNILKDVA